MKVIINISKDLYEYVKDNKNKLFNLSYGQKEEIAKKVAYGKSYDDIYREDLKEGLRTELKKIKEEICKKHDITCDLNCKECIYYPCLTSHSELVTGIKIIDKHIKENK